MKQPVSVFVGAWIGDGFFATCPGWCGDPAAEPDLRLSQSGKGESSRRFLRAEAPGKEGTNQTAWQLEVPRMGDFTHGQGTASLGGPPLS